MEVMVALTILLIVILPIGYLLDATVGQATQARQRLAALQLAEQWVEILSNSTPPVIGNSVVTATPETPVDPAGQASAHPTIAGTTFTVTSTYTEQSVNNGTGQSDLCSAGEPPSPNHPSVIVLQVQVSWDRGRFAVNDTTNLEYPQPGVQVDGFIAIQIVNSTQADVSGNSSSARVESIPVRVTNTSTKAKTVLYPDSNGCAFDQVPPGTYTVGIAQPTAGTPKTFTNYSGTPPFVTPGFPSTGGVRSYTSTPYTITVTQEQPVQLTFDEGTDANLTYASSTAVGDGVTCTGAGGTTCVTTGSTNSGAAISWGGSSSAWSTTTTSKATRIQTVACTTNGSVCLGGGYGPGNAGVILSTGSGGSPSSAGTDTLPPGVADITQIVCPKSDGCYAIGTDASGNPVLLAGAISSTSGDTWITVTAPNITFTQLTSIACPASDICELAGQGIVGTNPSSPGILRMSGDPGNVAGNPTWAPTFTADDIPPGLVSLGQVTCPSSSECIALGAGDTNSAADAVVLSASIADSGASGWSNDPLPATAVSGSAVVTSLSCSGSYCVTVGTNGGTPWVMEGQVASGGDTWSGATLSGIASVTSVACGQPSGSDLADCALGATSSAAISDPGEVLLGSLTSGGWSWNAAVSATSSNQLEYVYGVSCEPSGIGGTCAAVGATPQGPVVMAASGGAGGSWSVETPSNLDGNYVNNVPVEVAQTATTTWSTQVSYATALAHGNATSLPNSLYPYTNGYAVAAGDCAGEGGAGPSGSDVAAPGGTASMVVPLGDLPIEVATQNANGIFVPVAGATVSLTAASQTYVPPVNSTSSGTWQNCPADTYSLPATGPDGLSRSAVPFGVYTLTVTNGSTSQSQTIMVGTNPGSVTSATIVPESPTQPLVVMM